MFVTKASTREERGYANMAAEETEMRRLLARRRELDRLEVAWLAELAVFDRDEIFDYNGHGSAVAFLVAEAQMSRGQASRAARTARQLGAVPGLGMAALEGDISLAQLQVAADGCRRHPDHVPSLQGRFLESVPDNNLAELRTLLESWVYERMGEEYFSSRKKQASDQYVRVFPDRDDPDMARLQGLLAADNAEVISAALESLAAEYRQPDDGEERLRLGQAQAEGLTDLCNRYLNRTDRPTVGGERPHVNVIVNHQRLTADHSRWFTPAVSGQPELPGLPGPLGPGYYQSGTLVPWETVERLCCDAVVCRVVLDPDGLPLDVGRTTRTIPPAIRTAVVLRDRGCRWPGCDRPPSACDCHHVIYWTRNGPTAVWNLILLCRRHHRAVHELGFVISHDGAGGIQYHRPDGTQLAHQPNPRSAPRTYRRRHQPARAPAG